jgi:hypothetical protein
MALLIETLHRQGNRCGICAKLWQECTRAKKVRHEETFLQRLYVDHDHETGKVRGLLCNACNTGIGLFEEDPERLMSALSYVGGHARDSSNGEPDLNCR